MGKTILVTGDRGWVGGSLTYNLKEMGYIVKGYDLQTGQDINVVEQLTTALEGVDAVLHLAGMRGPDCDFDGAKPEDYETIHEGTKNVLKACKKAKVKRLIYLSTGAVYGTKLMKEPPGQHTPNGYLLQDFPWPITDKTPYCEDPHPYSYWKAKSSDLVAKEGGTVFYVNGLGDEDPSWSTSFYNIANAIDLAIKKDVGGKFNLANKGCRVDISKAKKELGYEGTL